jgi:PAS domain S-box-containing protein
MLMDYSQELLNAWVETGPDHAMILLDPAGNVATWNASAERLLGYLEAEIIGQPAALIFTPEDRQRGVPERETGEAQAVGRAEDERWHLRKDGSRFWGRGVLTLLRAEDGTPRGFVKAFRNLTAHRRLEDDLRQQAEELRDADRRKNEFLAMLAHELRNPLAPILNGVSLLRHRPFDETLVDQSANMIERQARNLKRMIDDLLDVSRLATGKLQLQKRRVALADVVTNAVEGVRPLMTERGHHLSVSLDAGLRLEADPGRLEQVLINLLANAAKYTGPGGSIGLTGRLEGSEMVIRVRDTGIGMAPELLPRIFDLYTQADPSPAGSRGGLGIGLTLVRNLVEMHGGSIEARSQGLGNGSEFIVRLPACHRARIGVSEPES